MSRFTYARTCSPNPAFVLTWPLRQYGVSMNGIHYLQKICLQQLCHNRCTCRKCRLKSLDITLSSLLKNATEAAMTDSSHVSCMACHRYVA